MVLRSPLVFVDGKYSQLPPTDFIDGAVYGDLVAGSGLVGGGDLSTGNKRLDLALSATPSGLIFVGDSIGLDGSDLIDSAVALASGEAGLVYAAAALASGVVAQEEASVAAASGNAALDFAETFTRGNTLRTVASSTVYVGTPVGVNDAGQVALVISSSLPIASSQNNFIGIAQSTASSGSTVDVLVPREVDYNQSNLSVGSFYYVDPVASGFTTASGQPATWSGAYAWGPVAKAVSSSGLLLLNPL
jgi:hypothetical protein